MSQLAKAEGLAGFDAIIGSYVGEGAWYDEALVTKRYSIELTIERLPDGEIRKWFKHDFFEEGTATEQAILLEPRANGMLAVTLENVPIGGRGYFSGDVLHYELDVPNNRVEVTLFFAAPGRVAVVGSSQKNAQGNYIWWKEELR